MKIHLTEGWRLTVKHLNIVILLFLYQLLWGFFLYRFIDSVAAPLLRRFPGSYPSEAATQLFLTEAQFQLLKTDLATPYLYMLGGLLLIRMLLTPLFNAGLFFSLHQTRETAARARLLDGIRRSWKPVMLLYWLESLLTLAPAWWLLPRALDSLLTSETIAQLMMEVVPGAILWVAWGVIVHLLSLAMQFGAVSRAGILPSLWRALKNLFAYAAFSLLMWASAAALGMAISSLSLLWAGLFALILHQGYHLVRTFIKVWIIAAQYNFLHSK